MKKTKTKKPLFEKVEYTAEFIPVDKWIPEEEDKILRETKGAIILPITKMYNLEGKESLDQFVIKKRGHDSDKMREHIVHYINYFEKFYDTDKELISVYCYIKCMIDLEDNYTEDMFIKDIHRCVFSLNMLMKIERMNRDNFLYYNGDKKRTKLNMAENLIYDFNHKSMLYKLSLMIKILVPLMNQFVNKNKLNVFKFIVKIFDSLDVYFPDVDLYSKLYETTETNTCKNKSNNHILWSKQDIRGINPTTHSLEAIENVILNVIPKYKYKQNAVSLNYVSINKTNDYKVTGIEYSHDFKPLSSSKRDEDSNSEYDKFESYLIKQDESLYLQNKVNCYTTMRYLERIYGPFDEEEINLYKKELKSETCGIVKHPFQEEMLFNLFYKYFGEPRSIKAINNEDYIKLIIIAKRMLEAKDFLMLQYVISSRIVKYVARKKLNKAESDKLKSSEKYTRIMNTYKNKMIEDKILSIIATILASDFKMIDYENKNVNGEILPILPDYLSDEIERYVLMVSSDTLNG